MTTEGKKRVCIVGSGNWYVYEIFSLLFFLYICIKSFSRYNVISFIINCIISSLIIFIFIFYFYFLQFFFFFFNQYRRLYTILGLDFIKYIYKERERERERERETIVLQSILDKTTYYKIIGSLVILYNSFYFVLQGFSHCKNCRCQCSQI